MDFNKFPRWALVTVAILGGLAVKYEGAKALAENDKTKIVAYEAKKTAETASLQVADLRGAIQEIKNSDENFRKEYREDQKELRELFLKPR